CPPLRFQLQRLLRASLRKEQTFPEERVTCDRPRPRRLASSRSWHMGIRHSVHSVIRQLRQRRRHRTLPPQPGRQFEYLEPDRRRLVRHGYPRHQRPKLSQYCHRYRPAERQRLHTRSLEPPCRRHFRQRHQERILRPPFLQHRCVAHQEVP